MVFRKERWMNTHLYRSNRFIKIMKFGAIILSLVISSLACGLSTKQLAQDAPANAPEPAQPADQPVQPPDQQGQPANQGDTSTGVVVGGWYGPACDEAEGTFIYRWSVDLMKNSQTGKLKGTIKFHDCPGGGRVLYSVTGDPPAGTVYTLPGQKMEGGGDLFGSAPETATYTFDSSTGQISPNLAP
jgi:hypothetical protein